MSLFFRSRNPLLYRTGIFFSKKNVDIEKKIQAKYICGNVAVIAYQVFNISDIIDPHSVPGHEILTQGFVNFLETNTEYIVSDYPIILEICGKEFSDEEKSLITRVIKENCDLLLGKFHHVKNDMIGYMIFSGICAVISYLIYFIFNVLAAKGEPGGFTAMADCLNIFFWVFAWEIVATAIFKTKEYRDEKKKAAQMASMNIRFYDTFDESTYSDHEQKEAAEEIMAPKRQ